jgi:hypothetical protein
MSPPVFLQVLKAAGESLFRNACELHCRSRLNNLDILMSPSFRRIWWQVDFIASCRSCNVSVAVLLSFTQNLMLTRFSNRTSILLTAKIATGKGHGDFRRVLPPSGGRAT